MLGLDKEVIKYTFDSGFDCKKREFVKKIKLFHCPYLPDETVGINKMFIYRDKIDREIVGNSKRELLCIVPLHYANESGDNLFVYNPPIIKKQLISSIIKNLTIKVLHHQGNYTI